MEPKSRYAMKEHSKLEPNMIRASIDMRIPNKYIKRSGYVQALIIEDFTYHLRGCKVFNKMDLKAGYHELSINEETRKLLYLVHFEETTNQNG